ncbi:hypothetical protein Bbelb_297450 [Branchiostoma belcheri]|nr:hypothetical protein Bbelb_297450 [Branchiostoma belcheri]
MKCRADSSSTTTVKQSRLPVEDRTQDKNTHLADSNPDEARRSKLLRQNGRNSRLFMAAGPLVSHVRRITAVSLTITSVDSPLRGLNGGKPRRSTRAVVNVPVTWAQMSVATPERGWQINMKSGDKTRICSGAVSRCVELCRHNGEPPTRSGRVCAAPYANME